MRMSGGLLTPCRVDDDRWSELSFDVRQLCTMAVKTAFATAGQIPHGEVSILLTNDALMSALNSKYRGKKQATNVLSFPAVLKDQGYIGENQPRLWGDVAVSIDRVTLEAKRQLYYCGEEFVTLDDIPNWPAYAKLRLPGVTKR